MAEIIGGTGAIYIWKLIWDQLELLNGLGFLYHGVDLVHIDELVNHLWIAVIDEEEVLGHES